MNKMTESPLKENSNIIYPGKMIKERILSKLNITATQLAIQLNVNPVIFLEVINGKTKITPYIADQLAKILDNGLTGTDWLDMQQRYDLQNNQ